MPIRAGPIWATVTVKPNHKQSTTNPDVTCNDPDCAKEFSGGSQRITEHILTKCKCSTEALQKLKAQLVEEAEAKVTKAKRKSAEAFVDAAANEPAVKAEDSKGIKRQRGIQASFAVGNDSDLDEAIAKMTYGCNTGFGLVCAVGYLPVRKLTLYPTCTLFTIPSIHTPQSEHYLFKDVIEKAKVATAAYKPPTEKRVGGDLLETVTEQLRAKDAPLKDNNMTYGCTALSDGWDDIECKHHINFLFATVKGAYFDGTVQLGSKDHEDAVSVANLLIGAIERQGPFSVVQLVTDTCSVMKAAWKIVEKKFPWITCTCCAPHVLSLTLNDIAKIPQVAAALAKARLVLNRMWGRKRWCRTKLREVAFANHGKRLGLYRAKPTRFAGRVKEMARMLRLKADLKYVVDSPDYARQDFKKKKKSADEAGADGDDELDGEGGIKAILQDEEGFWKPLMDALKVP